MADESRKVIIQLQIDSSKTLTELVNVKGRIEQLKIEQSKLNLTTIEGQKTFEAFNAQIRVLTKEQKSLEKALSDSVDQEKINQKAAKESLELKKQEEAKIKELQKADAQAKKELIANQKAEAIELKNLTKEQEAQEKAALKSAEAAKVESGSIQDNRNKLKELAAEYKNLANPTKEQTQALKDLNDKLKEQEGAYGDNRRSVGSYKEAVAGIQGQLGSFGPQITQLTQGFSGISQGLKVASKGFNTLKGAVAATGIGVLLLIISQLISYFKSTDEGATKLEGVMGALGAVTKVVSGVFAEIGSIIFGLIDGTESFGDVLENLGSNILENIMNRFKAFSVAGSAIAKLFEGDFAGAAKTYADAVIQLATGVEGGTDKLAAFAAEIAKTAEEAYQYSIQLDAVNDAQRNLDVTNAKSRQLVQSLIKQAGEKTKTDQQRRDFLIESNKIEEKSFNSQLELDNKRLALIKGRNEREKQAINQKLERDILEAKSEEKKIKLREKALSINDDLAQEQADLERKIIDAETEYLVLKQKNQNKISAFDAEIEADRQKAYDKYVAQLKEINALELSLENERRARVISNLDYELSKEELNADQKLLLLRLRADEEAALQKEILDERLAQLTTDSLSEEANQDAIRLQKISAEEETAQKLLDIERKYQEQYTEISKASEKKRTEDAKKQAAERAKLFQQGNSALQESLNIAAQINQDSLDREIIQNNKLREHAIKNAKGDKIQIDAINKRYDKINEDRTKKAVKTDLTLKQISAVANTATGFTQALAQGGILGIITGALVLAAGAVQIASIQTQKSKLAKGGLIPVGGNYHVNGGTTFTGTDGTVFEAEKNEVIAVVNRHDSPKLDYLSKINSIHGKSFFAPNRSAIPGPKFADGGLVARTTGGGINETQTQINAMQEAIRNTQIVVGVKDIVGGVNKKVKVVDRANVTK